MGKRARVENIIHALLPEDKKNLVVSIAEVGGGPSSEAPEKEEESEEAPSGILGAMTWLLQKTTDVWMLIFRWTIPDVNAEEIQEKLDATSDEDKIRELANEIQ